MAKNKKLEFIENLQDGSSTDKSSLTDVNIHPLEQHENQLEALKEPEPPLVIELFDGKTIELPDELNVGQVFKRRVDQQINSLIVLIERYASKYTGGKSVSFNDPATMAALINPVIQEELEMLAAKITGEPISLFEANLTEVSSVQLFTWVLKQLSKNNAGNQTNPKK